MEKPRLHELDEWDDHWQPPPPARWRKIISTTIILTVLFMAPAWSWDEAKSVLAMVFLALGVLIRYVDFGR